MHRRAYLKISTEISAFHLTHKFQAHGVGRGACGPGAWHRAEECSVREICVWWLRPEEPGLVGINPNPWPRLGAGCAGYPPAAPPAKNFRRGGGLCAC